MIRDYIKDIRFWIALFFIIRLFNITQQPLEIAHNWRQVTGIMVAHNFYTVDANILYPRVDMAGEKTGITGTEFPILNYLMYLMSLIFGYQNWYGRLINLIVSSIGIYYFYLSIKKYFTPKHAFFSGIILLSSMWFMYSRKTMPDTFSVSLIIISLYYALSYLDRPKIISLVLFSLFALAGVLSKIPAGYLFSILIIPYFSRFIKMTSKIILLVPFISILIIAGLWYFYWVPFLVKEYGFWHYYMGTSFSEGTLALYNNMYDVIKKFTFESLKYSGFIVTLAGVIYVFIKKEKLLMHIFLITSFFFILFMCKAGFAFGHHSYYVIPYVPVMAFFAGYMLDAIKKRWVVYFLLIFVSVEGIANQQHDFFTPIKQVYKLKLTAIADSVSKPTDLIVINGGYSPQELFFTNRKGWTLTTDELVNADYMKDVVQKGCRYLFINKHSDEFALPFDKKYEDEDFVVYKLIK